MVTRRVSDETPLFLADASSYGAQHSDQGLGCHPSSFLENSLQAPQMLIGPDEDRSVGNGDGRQSAFFQRVAAQNLERRLGGQDQRLALQVCNLGINRCVAGF